MTRYLVLSFIGNRSSELYMSDHLQRALEYAKTISKEKSDRVIKVVRDNAEGLETIWEGAHNG